MFDTLFVEPGSSSAIPLHLLETATYPDWLASQPTFTQHWLNSVGFTATPESYWLQPDAQGAIAQAVAGVKSRDDFWLTGNLARLLPDACYQLQDLSAPQAFNACCAWGLGAYQFTRYKSATKSARARLVWPAEVDREAVKRTLQAIYLVRDLINTPTEHMGPIELAQACVAAVAPHGATCEVVEGEALLRQNYPAIHAVGRAGAQPPRLIDIRWGEAHHPKLTLVGKGVCFDTGGLNLKPTNGMALMKKDMGGAAHAVGLATLIMSARLPVCLRVLIPAVENSVSGNAYRPGDVIATRKGLSIEITNTDAEGRLVLADALTEAVSEQPELLIDFATLTGAARIALGTDLPAFFTAHELLAQTLSEAAKTTQDAIWRLPLYEPYRRMLDSSIADLNNSPTSAYAGAITAALFLQEFVPAQIPWVHFDLMAWNLNSRAGRPEGGEAMALRAVWECIQYFFLFKKR
ncbi:MAG: leucyl aminopeptidase family protein [Gammaproteobacteria bacterium]|nr:leucyl aminopeptidase family protein [Gammaproteobacteria bacterium]